MSVALQAGAWGLLAGAALVLGAAVGWFASVPQRLVAGIMAFGSGVLISALALASGVAALAGYALFRDAPPALVAATTAVAAGAILAMLADTMIPEASEHTHGATGLITVAGFLAAFTLSKPAG